MPEFKPLPMKDIANPEPIHPASQKMTEWMNSYMPTIMDKINAGAVGPTNMGMSNRSGSGVADMLFKAVHPDTFNRVLDFLRPQSRQEGGPVEPGQTYTVGEEGPEKFKPAVPGQIIPYGREPSPLGGVGPSSGRSLTYAGMTDTSNKWDPRQAWGYEGAMGDRPEISPLGTPQTFKESWLGKTLASGVSPYENPYEPGLPSFNLPTTGGRESPVGKLFRTAPGILGEGYRGITGETAETTPGTTPKPIGQGDMTERYPTPKQIAGYGAGGAGGGAGEGGGWLNYTPEGQPTGIRYKDEGGLGLFPFGIGDEMARQRILREATPDLRLPSRSYYEAHPEEKAAQDYYDMMRGPGPSSYEAGVERMREMNLMDIVKSPNTTAEARKAATEQLTAMKAGRAEREGMAVKGAGELWGRGMEYGPMSPLSQERLAHARNLEMQPWMHMAGIDAQTKAHLEGIRQTVEGHIEAAKIATHVKEPLMKQIGAALAMGVKNAQLTGEPFNFYKDIGMILKVAHATGDLTDEQYAKIPSEYKQAQTRRLYLKGVAYDIPEEKIAMMKSKYPDLKDKP